MTFMEECIRDSLPIWQRGLDSPFLTGMENGTLDEECFKGYLVDDSLYLWQYAKIFAWGIIGAENAETMRTFYSFLFFVNEGEGSTRRQYLSHYGLTDAQVEKLPQRPESKRYTDYLLKSAQEGAPECMMAGLPCTLSYGWIFRELLRRSPSLRDSIYWPMVRDYTEKEYEDICRQWMAFGDRICQGLPPERLNHCREIFRNCSLLGEDFWRMSQRPRTDL